MWAVTRRAASSANWSMRGYLDATRLQGADGSWIWDYFSRPTSPAPTIDASPVGGSPVDGQTVGSQAVDITHTLITSRSDKSILDKTTTTTGPPESKTVVVVGDLSEIRYPDCLHRQCPECREDAAPRDPPNIGSQCSRCTWRAHHGGKSAQALRTALSAHRESQGRAVCAQLVGEPGGIEGGFRGTSREYPWLPRSGVAVATSDRVRSCRRCVAQTSFEIPTGCRGIAHAATGAPAGRLARFKRRGSACSGRER